MDLDESKKSLFVGFVCLSLLALFVAACGSGGSSTTGGSTTASATPTCPPNRFKTTTGIVQSITGTSLLVKNTQGSNVQASYTTTTRFQQQTAATTTALKDGTFVTIAVTADANNTYTATTITLVTNRGGAFGGGQGGTGTGNGGTGTGNGGTGTGGFGGGNRGTGQGRNANCFRQGGGAFGGGANGTGGTGTGGRAVTGTIAQLNGSILTVTDLQGSSYTVTVNAATKIVQFQTATANALKNGANLTITGSDDGKGGIKAQSITILLPTSNTSAAAA